MIRSLVRKIVFYLIKRFDLEFYKLEELQPWSHCGCCGKFIGNDIVLKEWPWSLCNNCIEDKEECYKI